ncbi:23S rRNA methyltransferase attenuation leader peptide [Enterococcus faecium]|nr:23S rRNA methyltransferase attenuation leader peptide [Ligilactobacillus agilis]HAP9348382.1 23S rRNA methyltransferase attenuation leader peptide [Enterococcus faecium]
MLVFQMRYVDKTSTVLK